MCVLHRAELLYCITHFFFCKVGRIAEAQDDTAKARKLVDRLLCGANGFSVFVGLEKEKKEEVRLVKEFCEIRERRKKDELTLHHLLLE